MRLTLLLSVLSQIRAFWYQMMSCTQYLRKRRLTTMKAIIINREDQTEESSTRVVNSLVLLEDPNLATELVRCVKSAGLKFDEIYQCDITSATPRREHKMVLADLFASFSNVSVCDFTAGKHQFLLPEAVNGDWFLSMSPLLLIVTILALCTCLQAM